MFPAGTTKRWEKLAAYVNDHSENEKSNKSAKECMQAFKKLHEKANDSKSAKGTEDSFEQFLRQRKHANESKPKDGEITESTADDASAGKGGAASAEKPAAKAAAPKPWTAAEQKLLEQALKTFPAALGKERWDKIAEAMPNRTKKECVMRYKEIVANIQAKKKAAAKVDGKK